MLSPLPRRNHEGARVVRFPSWRRPSPYPGGIGFRIRCFRGLLGVHCALRPACSLSPYGPFSRNASVALLPPQPFQVLPAGTTLAGRELHPLKGCAFARHTKMPALPGGNRSAPGGIFLTRTGLLGLVTHPPLRYRRAHGGSRRRCGHRATAGRWGRRALVVPAGSSLTVRARALAGGCCRDALRRAAPGGGGGPFPGGVAEVAARPVPGQSAGGRGGDEGSPAHRERRPCLAGRSRAVGEASFAGRCCIEQAQHDDVAAHGQCQPARQGAEAGGREHGAGIARGGAGSPAWEAALDPGGVVEVDVRAQERAAEDTGHGAQARSAARRARTWPHRAAWAQGEEGTEPSAERCARVFALRQALCGERRALHEPRRGEGLRVHAQDRAPPATAEAASARPRLGK